MGILFGPVFSRRLGISLGLDIVKAGHCSFDCVYCEAGKTDIKTLDPSGSANAKEVIDNLNNYFAHHKGKIDYLTFSGTGEPTLNPYIGDIIKKIKKKFKIPLCLLTNSSMLSDHDLVSAIAPCDLIMPSLDAISDAVFHRINRPIPGVYTELILIGLKKLITIAKGRVIIEIMLVKGINDNDNELSRLSDTINKLQPHGVVLNTVYRPPATNVQGLEEEELKAIGQKYFKNYLYEFEEKKINYDELPEYYPNDIKFKKMISIRSATLDELSIMLLKSKKETYSYIQELSAVDSRYYITEHNGIVRLHYDFEKQ